MPQATVGVIIYKDEAQKDQILLTKRNVPPFKDQWCLPGGHIEAYETSYDAVIRECREETGVLVEPLYLGYFDEIFPEQGIHNVALMFYGPVSGEPVEDEHEVSEIAWFDINDALSYELAFTHNEVLNFFKELAGL